MTAGEARTRFAPTVWALLERAAAEEPDGIVLADDHGRTLSRPQLLARAEAVAAGLAARGVRAGTVVSWQLPSVLESAVLLMALARLGAVQNPLIPILRARDVGFITRQVSSGVLIVPRVVRGFDHAEMAAAVTAGRAVDVLVVDLDQPVAPDEVRLPVDDPAGLPPPPERGDEVRWLYYTSGTTADPKGARHTDHSVMASASGMIEGLRFDATDVYPVAWPVAHIGGMTMLTASLVTGLRLVLFDTFDATTADRMAAHGPTLLGTAVPFFRAYLDAQARHGSERLYPNLRACMYGGAPVPPELHQEVRAAFGVSGIVGSWGLTEFPIATAATPDDPPDVLARTVGRLSPGVELRVVGIDGSDAVAGQEGELRLRGPQGCTGYVDRALDADGFDADGWFRTGDLGRVGADGNVVITGRLKDVIIRNAENISALEIENLVATHPAVAEVAVIGLPDPRTGERVCAVVVVRPGQALVLGELRDHCRARGLPAQKCPEALVVVDELPHNAMGKVVKTALRAVVAEI